MRAARTARLARALGLVLACAPACGWDAPAPRFARELELDDRGVIEIALEPGESLELSARAKELGAAPHLHLWDLVQRREVARGEPGWLSRRTALEYRPRAPVAGRYALLLERARGARTPVELWRGGRSWRRDVMPAAAIALPSGKGFTLQLAAVPGGPSRASLYALDCSGRLRSVDEASGPTGLPRIESDQPLCRAIATATERGKVRLYVNDGFDRDGDGLGRSLERALSLCDHPDDRGCAKGPLADYYRGVQHATRDTDRDGLPDADEVFGRSGRLDLPRYGANPRHKDVFVEVDHDARLPELGMREQDFVEIAALFAGGGARELQNPDDKAGVSLHFDVGFGPSDPRLAALLGDWGGSGRAQATNYRAARESDFSAERAGTFRYAFITRSGRGQARRDAFTVNRDGERVAIFAHELGHTLGLAHYGQAAWGDANCKPNYFSLMNYIYQSRAGVGFSRSAGVPLDPAEALETVVFEAGLPAAALREPPLELDVSDAGIDWNRDGLISREPVRAGLTWATYKSCGASGHARTTLRDLQLMAATPVLVKLGARLYAIYVDEAGLLYTRHGEVSGPDANGSCPEGDGPETGCTRWSLESLVYGLERVTAIAAAAAPLSGQLALAYTRDDGELRVALFAASGEVLALQSDVAVGGGARSRHAPALAFLPASVERYGADSLLRVLYRAEGEAGELMQASALGPEGPFRIAPVLDVRAQPIAVGQAPSLGALGTGEFCAVFPDPQRYVRFYCYDVALDGYRDLTQSAFDSGLGPQTGGPVGIAYHRHRLADGSTVTGDASRGAVVLSFTEPESAAAKRPDNPHLFISEWLSRERPAREWLHFRWRGRVIDEWTNLAPATGVALYEDESLSALKGLMLGFGGEPASSRLEFLPFMDGAREVRLGSGNDFEVMARGICGELRGARVCGI